MALFLSAVGSATAPAANELRTLAVFKETACERFCATDTVRPQVFVTYTAGQARLVGTTIFVPITATATVIGKTGCCKAQPFVFNETFLAAFQGYTTLPTTPVTISSLGQESFFPNACCGMTKCITINDSLLITVPVAPVANEENFTDVTTDPTT